MRSRQFFDGKFTTVPPVEPHIMTDRVLLSCKVFDFTHKLLPYYITSHNKSPHLLKARRLNVIKKTRKEEPFVGAGGKIKVSGVCIKI